jgi:hypothetical protein
MSPEQKRQLKAHTDAIAAILLADAKAQHPERLETLEGIELTVRQQIQEHVSPEIGVFLSSMAAAPQRENPAP